MLNLINKHNDKKRIMSWKPGDVIDNKQTKIENFKSSSNEIKQLIINNLSIQFVLEGIISSEEAKKWQEDENNFIKFLEEN